MFVTECRHCHAVAWSIRRLRGATDKQALARVWNNLGWDMKTDPAVQAEKDALKGSRK